MKHLFAIALLMISARALAADFAPLSAFLKDAVDKGEVAGGSVLVFHRGNVVFQKGFGFADLKNNTPFQVGTPVVVASISKPLLGTVAFRLSEQGKVNLAAPISESLPEFAGRKLVSGDLFNRAPTTLELFTHTSGIRQSESPGGRPWFATWTKGKPLEKVVKRYAAEFPFEAQPGTRYAYSGIGTDVAARVLEVASDKPRNELFVAELAGPLGMTHTFYRDAVSLKKTGPMPTRYYRGEEGKLLVSEEHLQLVRRLHHQHSARPCPLVDDDSQQGSGRKRENIPENRNHRGHARAISAQQEQQVWPLHPEKRRQR